MLLNENKRIGSLIFHLKWKIKLIPVSNQTSKHVYTHFKISLVYLFCLLLLLIIYINIDTVA